MTLHTEKFLFNYSFETFYIHYFSLQDQPILPVGQANASLSAATFQHHNPNLWYKIIPSNEVCETTSYQRTLLVSYH